MQLVLYTCNLELIRFRKFATPTPAWPPKRGFIVSLATLTPEISIVKCQYLGSWPWHDSSKFSIRVDSSNSNSENRINMYFSKCCEGATQTRTLLPSSADWACPEQVRFVSPGLHRQARAMLYGSTVPDCLTHNLRKDSSSIILLGPHHSNLNFLMVAHRVDLVSG